MTTELILAAWSVSVIVLFLPWGRVARFAQRRLRPAPAAGELPAPEAAPVERQPAAGDELTAGPPESLPWTTRKQVLGFFGSIATLGLYAVFILGIVYLAPRAMERALNTDHPIAAITSQSMYPALKRGDMVIMEGVDKVEDLQVGDIISFQNEEGTHLLIHRIVEIDGEDLLTKGDTRSDLDEPITFDDVQGRAKTIRGRLAKIPYLGNLTILFGSTSDPDAAEASPAPDEFLSDEQDTAPPPAEQPPDPELPNNDRGSRPLGGQ